MRQGKITKAYKTVVELYRIKGLPFRISDQLFHLKRRLQPFVEHQQEQTTEMLTDLNALNPDGTLNVTTENASIINQRLEEIADTDVEFMYEPPVIKVTDDLWNTLGGNGEMRETLDGIIIFEMEGE